MRRRKIQSSLPYQGLIAGIIFLDLWAYGGILQSGWVILCLLCVFGLIRLLKSDETADPFGRADRKAEILIWLLFGIVLFLDIFLGGVRYWLLLYLFYGTVLFYLILSLLAGRNMPQKKRQKFLYWLGLGELAGITAVFCLAAGFSTRQQAEAILEKDGFTGVEWVQTCETEVVSLVFFQTAHAAEPDMTAKEQQMDFYLFYGEKDQKGYCLVFSPAENELFRMVEIADKGEIRTIFGEPHRDLI